jgi:hypothetical protein
VEAARLILVEGMIGSTALRIGDCLAGQGENAWVFREAAVDQPIQTRAEDRLRACGHAAGDSAEYADDQWRQLAERCDCGRATIIIEASFLQNSVMPAFIEDAPGPVVDDIFDRITGQAAPAKPLLVYLRPAAVAAAVARVHRVRGEPWSSGLPRWRASAPPSVRPDGAAGQLTLSCSTHARRLPSGASRSVTKAPPLYFPNTAISSRFPRLSFPFPAS